MLKKLCLFILMTLLLLEMLPVTAAKKEKDPLELNCISAVLMDADTEQVVYQKNMNKKAYPASITKVLTVYLAALNCQPDEKITASEAAIDAVPRDSTNIAIDYGEILTVEQAANAAMLMSANDASNLLAEHVSGDMKAFAKLMNKTALQFGAERSNFTNSNGLPDENHYTTALDFAKITANAIRNEAFMGYFCNKEYTISPTNKKDEARPMSSKHRMLIWDSYKPLGAKGGKTGYTTQAKHTAVTYAEKDGRKWIAVVLGASTLNDQLNDTEALLTYGNEEVSSVTLSAEDIGTTQIGDVTYAPVGEIRIYLLDGMRSEDLTYEFNKKQVSVLDKDGNVLGSLPAEAKKPAKKEKTFAETLLTIALWILGIVVVFEIWRRHNIRKQRRKRRMQKWKNQIEKTNQK